jgi:hypothetical protein
MKIHGVEYEIVSPAGSRKGYVRVKPERKEPSEAQKLNRLRFSQAAFNSYGAKKEGELNSAAQAVKDRFEEEKANRLVEVLLNPGLLPDPEPEIPMEDIEFDDGLEMIKYLTCLKKGVSQESIRQDLEALEGSE